MEPECSLPRSQDAATAPYPEQHQSGSQATVIFF